MAETVPCSDWVLSKCRCPGACCEWFLCEHPYLPLPEWHRRTLCPPRWMPRRCRCQRACCEWSVLPVTAARSCSGTNPPRNQQICQASSAREVTGGRIGHQIVPMENLTMLTLSTNTGGCKYPKKTTAFFRRQSTLLAIWTYGTNPQEEQTSVIMILIWLSFYSNEVSETV